METIICITSLNLIQTILIFINLKNWCKIIRNCCVIKIRIFLNQKKSFIKAHCPCLPLFIEKRNEWRVWLNLWIWIICNNRNYLINHLFLLFSLWSHFWLNLPIFRIVLTEIFIEPNSHMAPLINTYLFLFNRKRPNIIIKFSISCKNGF